MSVHDIIQATHGTLIEGGHTAQVGGVCTDSRQLRHGELFIALHGPNFDGHRFATAAAHAGAAAILAQSALADSPGVPVIQVADTRIALGRLAAWWRDRFDGPLIALTGSNGKTTVKEMIAAILRAACDDAAEVLATEGNLNNDIGMPLTLLKLTPRHRYAVIEMGMNHVGEIDYLARIARPDVALVNNAQRAHVGELGDLATIAKSKGEIFAGLRAGGVAIINADDPHADYWRALTRAHRQITFGLRGGDVRGEFSDAAGRSQLQAGTPSGPLTIDLNVPGEHNARNALAATAAAVAVGVPLAAVARGLVGYTGTKGRLQHKRGLRGALLIDDTYNANPDSMRAALEVLARAAGARLFVMGDMGELGTEAPALHAEIGARARALGVQTLLAFGQLSLNAVEAFGAGANHFADLDTLIATARELCSPGMTVLVKGSRFMRMERVVDALLAEQA